MLDAMAYIIGQCVNTTAIALYYGDGKEPSFGSLGEKIVHKIASGKITEFGIYSMTILRAKGSRMRWSLDDDSSPMMMMHSLLSSLDACRTLQRLDIVLEDLSVECFELLT